MDKIIKKSLYLFIIILLFRLTQERIIFQLDLYEFILNLDYV